VHEALSLVAGLSWQLHMDLDSRSVAGLFFLFLLIFLIYISEHVFFCYLLSSIVTRYRTFFVFIVLFYFFFAFFFLVCLHTCM
jgi:hypothetical protein